MTTHGGSRPGNPNGLRGGARKNTGLVCRIELSKDDARLLRIVLLARYGKANKKIVNAFAAGWVRQLWAEYDAEIQKIAEEAAP